MLLSMDCDEMVERTYAYLDQSMDTGERTAVEGHLRSCRQCHEEVNRIRAVRGFMRGAIGPATLSANFTDRTKERVETAMAEDAIGEPEPIEAPPESFLDAIQARMGAAPWWLISGAFHALVLLLVTLIGMALLRSNDKDVVIVTDLREKKKPDEIEPPEKLDLRKQPVPIDNPELETVETPIVTHEEVEITDHVETADDSDFQETRGEDGISDVWLGGSGTVAALGLGGGGGGAFGRPNGRGGRLRRAIRGGGGQATESALDAALEWLARNQEAEGRWAIKKHGGGDRGLKESCDVGLTGLALLAFLGAGHTEKVGKYKVTVKKAIDWLCSKQNPDGSIGLNTNWAGYRDGSGYNHPLAGMALAEAYAMGRNPKVGQVAQKAVDYSVNVHYNAKRGAWRYGPPKVCEPKGDQMAVGISVTGWFVMQLKSAKVAGMKFDHATVYAAVSKMLDKHMLAGKVDGAYGSHRYFYDLRRRGQANPASTSMGLVCRLFMGVAANELSSGADMLAQELPRWDAASGQKSAPRGPCPHYYWYYGTLSMFQMGGEYWKRWNGAMKKVLLTNQRKDGDFRGSWDMLGSDGPSAGRAYTTAMGALCLEVYYRYLPMYRQ